MTVGWLQWQTHKYFL